MKTITKEIKLYKYNELSKEAKEKCKAKYLDIYCCQFDFEKLVRESLEKEGVMGAELMDIWWYLKKSQEDYLTIVGVMFFEELSDELKNKFFKGLSNEELKFFKQFEKYSRICVEELDDYFSCVEIYIELRATPEELYDLGLGSDFKLEDKETYYKISPKIEKNIKEWYNKICEKCKELGYKYFYEVNEDELNEYCKSIGNTERLFLENGDIYSMW